MITEAASIRVRVGEEARFEAAAREAARVLERAEGCLGFSLQRSVEDPSLYQALIRWRVVEDHSVAFRNGPLFQEWRKLVGLYFAVAPSVMHFASIFDEIRFTAGERP